VANGASALVFLGKSDLETLEALACREACALARDINARRVQVASDYNNAVRSLEHGTMGRYTHVVWEILDSRQEFKSLTFCHEHKISNKEAHMLARSVVLGNQGRQLWLDGPPPDFFLD
jgi:hypothetical protein